MLLNIWPGDGNLSSIDPECLAVLTYAKLTKVPLKINHCTTRSAITGTLPELQVEENVYSGTMGILDLFRLHKFNADYHLSTDEHADTIAFVSLLEQKLKPAFIHAMWLDASNFVNFTRPNYSKAFGFLPALFYMPRIHAKMQQYVNCIQIGTAKEKEIVLNENAKQCITVLSSRLGESNYFFGQNPSTLDTIVYGYLAILMHPDIYSSSLSLKHHLLSKTNLCNFVERINAICNKNSTILNKNTKTEEGKFPLHFDQTATILFGVTAMVLYGLFTGIIKNQMFKNDISISDENAILTELD